MVSVGVTPSGCCSGKCYVLVNTFPATSGVVTSRSGRPGPNVGLLSVVDGTVTKVPSNINMVLVMVTTARTPPDRSWGCKFLVSGVVAGVAAGSAVTILLVGHAIAGESTPTVSIIITARNAVAHRKNKISADDVSDAPLMYGAGGTPGMASMGAPANGSPVGNASAPSTYSSVAASARGHIPTASHVSHRSINKTTFSCALVRSEVTGSDSS